MRFSPPAWVASALLGLASTGVHAQEASITLLGTAGGPPPHVGRAQPSTLLEVGGRQYLIDAGEGAAFQLMQRGHMPSAVDAVFITHLHWDHTLGLDYLMATGWMRGRTVPAPVYGPTGLDFFISRQLAAIEVGESIFRSQAEARPPLASLYPAHQIDDCDPHEVFADEAVRVTAVCNSHFAELATAGQPYGEDRALSYRFDMRAGSVTITGDTGPSPELAALARGSDILVSEIVDLPSIERALIAATPDADITNLMVHMAHQHLTPEEVGKLATAAGVKTVVLTHYVVGQRFDIAELEAQVRAHFGGEVIVGRDLLVVPLARP